MGRFFPIRYESSNCGARIINLDQIVQLTETGAGRCIVHLVGGETIPLTGQAADALMDAVSSLTTNKDRFRIIPGHDPQT